MRERVRGSLEPGVTAEIDRHLAGCEGCRHEREAERLLDEALRDRLPRPPAPDALRRRIAATVEDAAEPEEARRPSWRPRWATALAAVVVASLAFVGGRTIRDGSGAAD